MKFSLNLCLAASLVSGSSAFISNTNNQRIDSSLQAKASSQQSRLGFLQSTAALVALSSLQVQPANALVKGNAPPPKKGVSEERKCRNVEECQEMAERAAAKADEEARANMVPASVTSKGTKYRELVAATEGAPVAKDGQKATIFYKVLKLGKRSYDGLSGEGTVVFSRGYGLEDDENKAGVKSFEFTIGDPQVIGALNDAIVGQPVGSTRRVAILPQMGWEKATRECDGGPGGSGTGGELKTDYVVVPTATMVQQEFCFDTKSCHSQVPMPNNVEWRRDLIKHLSWKLSW